MNDPLIKILLRPFSWLILCGTFLVASITPTFLVMFHSFYVIVLLRGNTTVLPTWRCMFLTLAIFPRFLLYLFWIISVRIRLVEASEFGYINYWIVSIRDKNLQESRCLRKASNIIFDWSVLLSTAKWEVTDIGKDFDYTFGYWRLEYSLSFYLSSFWSLSTISRASVSPVL